VYFVEKTRKIGKYNYCLSTINQNGKKNAIERDTEIRGTAQLTNISENGWVSNIRRELLVKLFVIVNKGCLEN
jgi:hypothetical protein